MDIINNLNMCHAKLVAMVLVIGCYFHHWKMRSDSGQDSCDLLMTSGHFKGDHVWQPTGCMLHIYTEKDVRKCFKTSGKVNRLTFMGDSRVRYQYQSLRVLLTGEDFEPVWRKTPRANFYYGDSTLNLQLNFIWNEAVNETIFKYYRKWAANIPVHKMRESNDPPPTVLVTGGIAWPIKHLHEEGNDRPLQPYMRNVTKLLPYIDKMKDTSIFWMAQEDVVEMPFRSTTNHLVKLFNKAVEIIFQNTRVQIWKSNREIALGYENATFDGLHVIPEILQHDMQVFLNMYCNEHIRPRDGTCCKSQTPSTNTQLTMAILFSLSLTIYFVIYLWEFIMKPGKQRQFDETNNNTAANGVAITTKRDSGLTMVQIYTVLYDISKSISRLGIIMLYIYACDSANIFMKETRVYSHEVFFCVLIILFLIGLVFSRKTKQSTILNRDQTDEWKGWMQLVILWYHINAAHTNIGIYMTARLLVAMYLFLFGFGHFHFYLTKADYSLQRLFMVLFRYNFLTVMLCLCMNRYYMIYYFVPLVSFWLIVIYVVMAMPPRVTLETLSDNVGKYSIIVLKFLMMFSFIVFMHNSPVLFVYIFTSRPLSYIFEYYGSISNWQRRWTLDRFSVIYGMLFALILHICKKNGLVEDKEGTSIFHQFQEASRLIQLLSLSIIYGFLYLYSQCATREDGIAIHEYFSVIPIVAFVLLRNTSEWFRSRYSVFFAWIGKISLELFVAQYHLFMAEDGHGMLVLLPDYPVLNMIMTSFIFVCIAHEIHEITSKLALYFVPDRNNANKGVAR